jgi:hypothetical protein
MRLPSRAIVAIALSLLAPLALLPPPAETAPKPAPRVALQNGDFERAVSGHHWMPAGWDTSRAELPTVFFGRDTFLVHSGRYAVSVANMSHAFPLGHNWNQTLLVGPELWGKQATLRVWVRSNGVEGRAYLLLQAYNDTASRMGKIWNVDHDEALKRLGINKIDDPLMDLAWKRTQFSEPLTDWVLREARIVVPYGTNVMFVRCGLIGTGQVLFDDASLTFAPAPPAPRYARGVNLLADPGFEEGGLIWDISIPPYEGSRIDLDSTVAHGGRNSIRLSEFWDGVVEARIGVGQPFPARALRGQRVRMSAWIKGDSLTTVAFTRIYSHGIKSRVVRSPSSSPVSGSDDWREVSTYLDVPEDAEQVWAHVIALAPARGRVWFDDARFEVEGPSPGRAAPAKPAATSKPAPPGKGANR